MLHDGALSQGMMGNIVLVARASGAVTAAAILFE
jgi:hypothetical protein